MNFSWDSTSSFPKRFFKCTSRKFFRNSFKDTFKNFLGFFQIFLYSFIQAFFLRFLQGSFWILPTLNCQWGSARSLVSEMLTHFFLVKLNSGDRRLRISSEYRPLSFSEITLYMFKTLYRDS